MRVGGDVGRARIVILTITIEAFGIVRNMLNLPDNIGDPPYFVANCNSEAQGIVLRRASAQTNLISAEVVGEIIEDFRPDFILLIGTAGGYRGRDDVSLGDVVVGEYVEYSGYWKLRKDRSCSASSPTITCNAPL